MNLILKTKEELYKRNNELEQYQIELEKQLNILHQQLKILNNLKLKCYHRIVIIIVQIIPIKWKIVIVIWLTQIKKENYYWQSQYVYSKFNICSYIWISKFNSFSIWNGKVKLK